MACCRGDNGTVHAAAAPHRHHVRRCQLLQRHVCLYAGQVFGLCLYLYLEGF